MVHASCTILGEKKDEHKYEHENCTFSWLSISLSLFLEIFLPRRFLNTHMRRYAATAAAKSRQSCPTLCDPIDSSPRGSPVPGILQARTLEWVAISFTSARKWKGKVKSLSRIQLFATHGLQPTRLVLEWGAIAYRLSPWLWMAPKTQPCILHVIFMIWQNYKALHCRA